MKNNTAITKYLSPKAPAELVSYIVSRGYEAVHVKPCQSAPAEIADHPDIQMCRLGAEDSAPVFFGDAAKLGPDYPADVPYNAACTGRFFIHNTAYTDPALLAEARKCGMTIVDVKQGYAKCSCALVDDSALITYDKGIADKCDALDISVLLVSPGFVELQGYKTGFIGGCSGRVGDTIVFNGNLRKHPDFDRILHFIEARGLKCKWFEEWPLTDIGSII